jgi:hypothetical protein
LRLLGIILGSTLIACGYATAEATDDANSEIVGKYVAATKIQQETLLGAQMEVNIDAKLPKLEKQGRLRALRIVSRLGKITYRALGFSGDTTVKQEVIARYLNLEVAQHDQSSIAVTPENYKFQLKTKLTQGDRHIDIFQLNPKKNKIGLFKGELWVDADTGMPIRVSGRWVKSPSVFVKKVEFVQEFELQNGVSLPSHIESTVDTRVAGRAELSINFTNFSHPDNDDDVPVDALNEVAEETSGH